MKYFIHVAFFALIASSALLAQKIQPGLTVTDGQFSLSSGTLAQIENGAVPFIEGKSLTGGKERFGILLRTSQGASPFLELLDGAGKVVKTVSVNEFLGKSNAGGVKLVSSIISAESHNAQIVHELTLASGPAVLRTNILVSGEKGNAKTPEEIVVTFSVKSEAAQALSVRLLLPIEGSAEVEKNGAVLSGKNSPSAIAVSVLPSAESIAFQKSVLTVKGPAVNISGETPLLWLVARPATGSSQATSKTAAADIIAAAAKAATDPNIVVVNSVSKLNAQPGDTVTYTLTCKNIGAGDATNVQLSNPVPSGTSYLDGSATGDGTDMTFDKAASTPPQESKVTLLRWKLREALKPGHEQVVTFKVIVE